MKKTDAEDGDELGTHYTNQLPASQDRHEKIYIESTGKKKRGRPKNICRREAEIDIRQSKATPGISMTQDRELYGGIGGVLLAV